MLIWHSLQRRWTQTLATFFAVAIGAGMLFAIYLLAVGVARGVTTSERRMGADFLVVPGDAPIGNAQLLFTGEPVGMYMTQDLVRTIAALPGVQRVTAQFYAQSLNASCCSTAGTTRLIGFDPASDWLITALLPTQRATRPDDIYVGAEVQGFTGHSTFLLGQPVHIAGVLARTGTSLDQSIVMPIALARRMAKAHVYYQHFWDTYGAPEGLVSAILIKAAPDADAPALRRAILQADDVRVVQSADVFQGMKAQLKVLFLVLFGVAVLTLLSLACQLYARFFTLARDRKGEWGLYRALGASQRDVKALVTGEALLITLGGTLAGILCGGVLALVGQGVLGRQQAFPYIPPTVFDVSLGIGALLVLFALLALLPARVAARQSSAIEPSLAMALEDID